MKFIAIFLFLISSIAAQAQSIQVGGEGGYSFSSYTIGPEITVMVPVHRLEIGAHAEMSPALDHVGIGSGYGYSVRPEARYYIGRSWFAYGGLTRSFYSANDVHKAQYYVRSGFTLDSQFIGAPARYTFAYFREVHNGLLYGGTESSHLQGGLFRYEAYLTDHVLIWQEISSGGVLEQGNPMCDGTFGKVTCPRTRTLSGGVVTGIEYVWSKHKGIR